MNKRELMLNLVHAEAPPAYVPAAFFLHFDPAYHTGQAAIDRHLAFFHTSDMDLVKIQFEQRVAPAIGAAEDWKDLRPLPEVFFEPTVRVVDGLVQAAKRQALVVLTLYSPFMWMVRIAKGKDVGEHFTQHPQAAALGLEIMTESVLNLVRACRRVGVDGFYASTQGGEADRLPNREIFRKHIKPADLTVWQAIQDCEFNVLHICDYEAAYDDLADFLDYPGHVVNASLHVGEAELTPGQVAAMFSRPFMGGMDRLGVIATGPPEDIRMQAEAVLAQAPERFILAADCTVPADTPWEHLQAAIQVAHAFR